MIKSATLCAAAIAWVPACGGSVSNDAAPTSHHAAAATTTSESASQCPSATEDAVKSAAHRAYGDAYQVLCSGDWAKALIDTSSVTNANPPSILLFHNDGDGWRLVQHGSGFNCTSEGVPPSAAVELEC